MVGRRHPNQPYNLSDDGEGDTRLSPGATQGWESGDEMGFFKKA